MLRVPELGQRCAASRSSRETRLAATQAVQDALGTADKGNVLDLPNNSPRPTSTSQIAPTRTIPSDVLYQLASRSEPRSRQPGQQRESLTFDAASTR